MNLNIFVPGLESYMEDINITNNVNTEPEETPVEEVEADEETPKAEEASKAEEAPKAEDAPAETTEEIEDQKEELFVSFWK